VPAVDAAALAPVDAVELAAAPIDAVDMAAIDAAAIDAGDLAAIEFEAPTDAAPAPAVRHAVDLGELVEAGRYAEVVTICSNLRMTSEGLARRGFAAASTASRAQLSAVCRASGLELDVSSPVPRDAGVTPRHRDASACDLDPMACPH
jgi:hypothetical protein